MVVNVKIEEEKAMIPTHHKSSKVLDKETVSSFFTVCGTIQYDSRNLG